MDIIKLKCNPNATDNDGNTAMHYCLGLYDRDPTTYKKIFDNLVNLPGI